MPNAEPTSHPPAPTGQPGVVSVIIAAYNAAGFIADTCRSVIRQTYTALDIIVVDDGSTDRTSEVVEGLALSDPRIRLIRQPNLGVAAARNRGIAAASGEFIAPLDADDLWDPTKIARQVDRLRQAGPGTGLVYCWWAWIDVHGAVLDRSPSWSVEGQVLERLVEVNFTGSASVPLYRRAFLEAVGGYDAGLRDKGAQGCEDWDLALRIAERGDVAVVPAVLVGYRRRGDSMSSACETMWGSQALVMSALALRSPSLSPAAIQRSKGQFALHLAGVSFWSRDYLGACRWALRARPVSLVFTVLPHVARMIARRMRIGPSAAPPMLPADGRIDDLGLADPLIPYDRIYARHWRGRKGA